MGLEIPPLDIKILFESNPLKSRILVQRLAVLSPVSPTSTSPIRALDLQVGKDRLLSTLAPQALLIALPLFVVSVVVCCICLFVQSCPFSGGTHSRQRHQNMDPGPQTPNISPDKHAAPRSVPARFTSPMGPVRLTAPQKPLNRLPLGVFAIRRPFQEQPAASAVSSRYFHSQKLKLRVPNPRTFAYAHFKMPFESSKLPGPGPIFPC